MGRLLIASLVGFLACAAAFVLCLFVLGSPQPMLLVGISLGAGFGASVLVLRGFERTVRTPHGPASQSRHEPVALEPEVDDAALLAAVRAELHRSTTRTSASALLSVSLLVSMALMLLGDWTLTAIACLAAVLLFHEAGHALAMRAFGYADVRIFFIPFVGAVTQGLKRRAAGWQRLVVLLAGPVPGLILGYLLLRGFPHEARGSLVRNATFTLLGVNAFNLLPLEPLDGGRIASLLLFRHLPRVRVVFSVVTGGVLLYLVRSNLTLAAVIAATVMLRAHREWLVVGSAARLRPRLAELQAPLPERLESADDSLLALLLSELPRQQAAGALAQRARQAVGYMRSVWDMLEPVT